VAQPKLPLLALLQPPALLPLQPLPALRRQPPLA
jgi:hypothetical protein